MGSDESVHISERCSFFSQVSKNISNLWWGLHYSNAFKNERHHNAREFVKQKNHEIKKGQNAVKDTIKYINLSHCVYPEL